MTLAKVNEELHRRRRADGSVGDPPEFLAKSILPEPADVSAPAVPLGDAWGGQEQRTEPVAPGMRLRSPLRRLPKKIVVFLGGLALLLIVAGVIFKSGGWLFTAENVRVTVTGPKRVASNETVEYIIRYENSNWIDLDDAELIVTYPQSFRLASIDGFDVSATRAVIPLGTVKKSSQNNFVLRGSFQSLQDQVALLTVTLRSAPQGISSRVDTEYQYSIAVESSAVIVELSAPAQAGDNQFVDYVATYRNESTETIGNLELVIAYPDGFTFRESTPTPTRGENIWAIPTLGPGESGTVTTRGFITGGRGDVKRVTAKIGVPQGDGSLYSYAEIDRQTRIVASPLVISQRVGIGGEITSVEPGQTLPYKIVFRNDGDIGLRDLIVTVDLDPQYFDVSKLNLTNGGAYNIAKRQAVFRAADQKGLALLEPGQSSEIVFSVPVRADLPESGRHNVEIESIARVDSPDVPTPIGANKIIASNRLTLKVKTALLFTLSGSHFDTWGNTGPVPPVVGQETAYTLTLGALSTLNAIEDARVVLSVPGQVRYLKTHANDQGTVVYNDRTGEISWNIGTVAPGGTRPTTLTLQIGLTPDPSQALAEARLVNTTVFTGKDVWSGDMIRQTLPSKTTDLKEDIQIGGSDGGKVRGAE